MMRQYPCGNGIIRKPGSADRRSCGLRFLLGAPFEQPHGDEEYRLERNGRRSLDTAVEYPTVEPTATEKTRTAKAAVRATYFVPLDGGLRSVYHIVTTLAA